MITHFEVLTIDKPVDEVFAFVTDASNSHRWDASSLAMEADTAGPWKPGTTFREVRQMGPRKIEFQSKVAALVPNESFDIDSVTGPEFHGHWRVAARGSGTELRWSCEMGVTGPGRVFQPLIARSFKKGCKENFARLKRLLETGDGGLP